MALIEFAERELREAGWFKKDEEDGMYDGMIGDAVLELIRKFAEQGHSGVSAGITLNLFNQVARYKLLNRLKNPTLTGEYIDRAEYGGGWQSSRVSSVFSEDGGKTWYDIDKKVPRWKRIFGVRRHYLKFNQEGILEN